MSETRSNSRRRSLRDAGAILGGVTLAAASGLAGRAAVRAEGPDVAPDADSPGLLTDEQLDLEPALAGDVGALAGIPRVVHVHAANATRWDGKALSFWNYVNQDVVTRMVRRGVMTLTGATTLVDAWRALIPAYKPGQKVAIKINLNNSRSCSSVTGKIDALIQPVNAVIRGLKLIGVAEKDIRIYDAMRMMPDRLIAQCAYPGVRFYGSGACRNVATFASPNASAVVKFTPPAGVAGPTNVRLADILIGSTYLINMPIMKNHTLAGVTLGFKCHFGTINCPSCVHPFVGADYPDYNGLLDIFRSRHVGPKTVLTIGDGLFASRSGQAGIPSAWASFGNKLPNSLFFSTDPVAIDCVMVDHLAAEIALQAHSDKYLRLAGAAGMGTYERGDPWGVGYGLIDYRKVEVA